MTQFPRSTLQYIYPTEIRVPRLGRIPKLKKNLQSKSTPGVLVFPREIKNIDNRYDYTLHVTQDEKHHDNARTNGNVRPQNHDIVAIAMELHQPMVSPFGRRTGIPDLRDNFEWQ